MSKRRKMPIRTAQRVAKLAYEIEDLARRLRYDGHESYAAGILAVSRSLGNIGRSMLDTAERDAK